MKKADLSLKARSLTSTAAKETRAGLEGNPTPHEEAVPQKGLERFSTKTPVSVAPTDLPFKRGLVKYADGLQTNSYRQTGLWTSLTFIAQHVEKGLDELQNAPLLEPKRPADVDKYHPLHDFTAKRRIDRNVGWIKQWLEEHADDREQAPEGLKRTMEETLFLIPSAGFSPSQSKKLESWLMEKASGLIARSSWWRQERRDRVEAATNRLAERAGEFVTTEQRIECLWRRFQLLKSIGASERDQRLALYALYDVAEKSACREPTEHLPVAERRVLLVKVIEEQRGLLSRLGGRNKALEDTLFLSTHLLEKTPADETNAQTTWANLKKEAASTANTTTWKPLAAAMSQVESGNVLEARRLLQEILDRPVIPGNATDQRVREIARSVLIQETQVRIDRTMAIIGALAESRFSEERWSTGRSVVSRTLRHVRDYIRSLPPDRLPRSFEETLKGFAAKNPTYRQDDESFTLLLNDMGGAHSLSDYSRSVPEEKGPVWALIHAMDRVEQTGGVRNALTALESVLDRDTSYLRGHGDLEGALLAGAEMLKGYTNDRDLHRAISKFQEKVPSYESWGRILRQTFSARTVLEIAFCLAAGALAGVAGRAASAGMRTRLVAQVGRGGQTALMESLELGTLTRQTALIRAGMSAADLSANATLYSMANQAKGLVVDGHVQNPITATGHSLMDIGLLKLVMGRFHFMPLPARALLAGGGVMQAGKALRGEEVTFQGAFSDMAFALGNDLAGHHVPLAAPEAVSSEAPASRLKAAKGPRKTALVDFEKFRGRVGKIKALLENPDPYMVRLEKRLGRTAAEAKFQSVRDGALSRLPYMVDTNLDIPGGAPQPSWLDGKTIDHHGRFEGQDRAGLPLDENAGMKVIAKFREALSRTGGDVRQALADLRIRRTTTDNLGDGALGTWLLRNAERVLTALRNEGEIGVGLKIEDVIAATDFEDFQLFRVKSNDPAYQAQTGPRLGAALVEAHNRILARHREAFLPGTDRFNPKFSGSREKILAESLAEIDRILADPQARETMASEFFASREKAIQAAESAVVKDLTDRDLVVIDTNKMRAAYPDMPTFLSYAAPAGAAARGGHRTQLTFGELPSQNGQPSRRIMIGAIPDTPVVNGKSMKDTLEALNAAEALRAKELGAEIKPWAARANVAFNFSGSLITPEEASNVIRSKLGLETGTVLNRMKGILGVTDDTYVYRASRPQWIRGGEIGLNKDSVALVHDPYHRPELLSDIERAYSDVGAADVLFDSMWQNATKASSLENPGLNVSTNEAEILARYGGGPGSERVLIRVRLGDIPNARLYPDVGGGTGDKTVFYVTGEGSSVPVEVYDHAAGSWVSKNALEALNVLETNEAVHARIERMIEEALDGPGSETLRAVHGLKGMEMLRTTLRTRLRAEFDRIIQQDTRAKRLEDVSPLFRNQIVSTFEKRASSLVSELRSLP